MSWGDLLLPVGVIATTAMAYGLPLTRRVAQITGPDSWPLRLAAGFGFGLVVLFALSALIHGVLPLDFRGREGAAWCVLLLVPAWLAWREVGIVRREKSPPPSGNFWLPLAVLFLAGGTVAFSTFSFPGLLKFGLGDQVESFALAKSLYQGTGYRVPYLIFDFPHHPEDLQAVIQTGRVQIEPIPSRLPFLPLLTALYLYLLPNNPLILSCLLFLAGAAVVPLAHHWIRIYGERLGWPVSLLPLEPLVAMGLLLPLSTMFLTGFIEAVTLLYLLLAFILLLRWQNRWSDAWMLLFCLLPPLFIKGEGGIVVLLLGLFFLLPLFLKLMWQKGIKGGLPLLVMGVVFLVIALPWVGYVARHGAVSNSAINIFKSMPDGNYQVKNGPYLQVLEEHYAVEIDPATLTYRAPAGSTEPPSDALLLKIHLEYMKFMKDSVFLYNFMLGMQSLGRTMDLSTYQPESWQSRLRILRSQIARDAERMITFESGKRLTLDMGLGLLLLLILSLFREEASRWLSARYLLFFISLITLLDIVNPGIFFLPRFLVLFLPFLLILVLTFSLWLCQSRMGNTLLRCMKFSVVHLALVAILAWGFLTEAVEVSSLRKDDHRVARIMDLLKEHTPTDALVSSSMPQYVGALAERQAIGHADNILFLHWQVLTYHPSHILIFKRPDWSYDEYRLFIHFRKNHFLSDYQPVYSDSALEMIILERTGGTSNLDRGDSST
ncbi:MAG: hypothetical protein HQL64_02625 [Magnetococcales bacterium]|nr:hypothetical protein [Magnetococcales bacterium]